MTQVPSPSCEVRGSNYPFSNLNRLGLQLDYTELIPEYIHLLRVFKLVVNTFNMFIIVADIDLVPLDCLFCWCLLWSNFFVKVRFWKAHLRNVKLALRSHIKEGLLLPPVVLVKPKSKQQKSYLWVVSRRIAVDEQFLRVVRVPI